VARIEFDEVSKLYGKDVWAVRELDLTVEDAEFVVLVGPSGCGKTTALRMLAGLEQVTAGEIRLDGKRLNEVPPRDRDIAMVFQSYALYPHMNVWDNIGYGLKVRRVPKEERAVRIGRAASTLGLRDQLTRKPRELSGGQRQRVAMGRAIVREPKVFLMDEPLSNLDARLRVHMRTEIAGIQRDLGVSTLYVTHDQVEAMTMADRVAVLRRGVLQQFDTPQRVYAEPTNLFVATFIGSPAMNVVEGVLLPLESAIQCRIGSFVLEMTESMFSSRRSFERLLGETVAIGIRPEAIALTRVGEPGLEGTVLVSEALGSEVLAHIEIEATPVVRDEVLEGLAVVAEDPVDILQHAAGKTTVVARLPAQTILERGDSVTLTIDPGKLHFFDLADGSALRTY
jgi:multiple sugar transport system ATP-binding protein